MDEKLAQLLKGLIDKLTGMTDAPGLPQVGEASQHQRCTRSSVRESTDIRRRIILTPSDEPTGQALTS